MNKYCTIDKKFVTAFQAALILICCVLDIFLYCLLLSFFPDNKDPYIFGLEEVVRETTGMRVVKGETFGSTSVLIEDPEQVRAAVQLILDGIDGNRTFHPSLESGGKVYGITFYRGSQVLYGVVIHPEIRDAIILKLPDHCTGSDVSYRRGNNQLYASTNRREILELCDKLLP